MPVITGQTNPDLFPLYYERKLIKYNQQNLLATRFGQKFSFEPNSGRIAVFTMFSPLPVSTTPITDKPTPQNGASISSQQVTVKMDEYANYIDLDEFTDITSFVPLVDRAVNLLSYNAQQTLDRVAMKELASGTNVLYAGGVSSRAQLDGTKKLTKAEIRKAVNLLQRVDIPTFPDGYYVCLIHPDKLFDLFTDEELIRLSLANSEAVEKGYIGAFAGVKFYFTTACPILPGEGGGASDVYQTLVFGMDAYGVVDINGANMQMVSTNVDKLGRVKTIGWKAYFAAKRLYEPAIVRIESN